MAGHVCPVWIGYILLNPLRRLFENPERMLGSYVRLGMTVLEPGPGMGYFTLPLARMVGPSGKVIAVELQEKMLSALHQRAVKAGLSDRIELRKATSDSLGLDDLVGQVDFAAALHLVHEIPDQQSFFTQMWHALKQQGTLFVLEPRFHVSRKDFDQSISVAQEIGFKNDPSSSRKKGLEVLLTKDKA